MPDQRSVMKEFRFLDEKRRAGTLRPSEQARYAQLRELVGPEMGAGGLKGFDVNAAAERLRESLLPAGLRNRPPPAPEISPEPEPEPFPLPEDPFAGSVFAPPLGAVPTPAGWDPYAPEAQDEGAPDAPQGWEALSEPQPAEAQGEGFDAYAGDAQGYAEAAPPDAAGGTAEGWFDPAAIGAEAAGGWDPGIAAEDPGTEASAAPAGYDGAAFAYGGGEGAPAFDGAQTFDPASLVDGVDLGLDGAIEEPAADEPPRVPSADPSAWNLAPGIGPEAPADPAELFDPSSLALDELPGDALDPAGVLSGGDPSAPPEPPLPTLDTDGGILPPVGWEPALAVEPSDAPRGEYDEIGPGFPPPAPEPAEGEDGGLESSLPLDPAPVDAPRGSWSEVGEYDDSAGFGGGAPPVAGEGDGEAGAAAPQEPEIWSTEPAGDAFALASPGAFVPDDASAAGEDLEIDITEELTATDALEEPAAGALGVPDGLDAALDRAAPQGPVAPGEGPVSSSSAAGRPRRSGG